MSSGPAFRSSIPMRAWTATLLLLGGSIAALHACSGPELDAVHFHTYRPDFLRIPQPWQAFPRESGRGLADLGETLRSEPEAGTQPDPGHKADELLERAMSQEAAGHFRDAAGSWERYSAMTSEEPSFGPDSPGPRRGGLLERVAALRDWHGEADTEALRQVLRARDLINAGNDGDANATLRAVVSPRFRWHADYLRAVMVFQKTAGEASAAAFQVALRSSPGNIVPLYMVGRSYFRAVEEAAAHEDASDGPAGATPKPPPAHPPLPEDVRKHMLRAAESAYDHVARADPNGNLGRDAAGMVAACEFRLEEYAPALRHYCRQLAKVKPGESDEENWVSARHCLKQMSAADHQEFQFSVVDEPGAAGAYLDLLLHYGKPTVGSAHRLGEFALQVLRRSRDRGLSAPLLTRLATIEDRCGHPDHAVRLADSAIRALRPGTERDQAHWCRAMALHHLRRDADAVAELERVIDEAKLLTLRVAAHQAAAVLYENSGDRVEALRHYFALDSRLDYSYLIDCLMSEAELNQFLARHPADPHTRLVRYSIGFRQLRRGDYHAAEQTFLSLGSWLKVAEKKFERLTSHEKPTMSPLRFARAMQALQAREAAAHGPEEKAQAAYETGQLLFYQRHLVFYNGALWQGGRTWALEMNHPYDIRTRDTQLSREEQAKLDRYQQEHAAVFHAAHVFERIVHDYPHTRVAPRALYSAALSYTLLEAVEGYWHQGARWEKKATGLYRQLLRDYPNDPLAPAAAKFGGAVRTGNR